MKTLNKLNHLLNLNYDVTLSQELIERAYVVMQELANDIESTWEVYKDQGYYIDEESFNLMNEVLGELDELSNKLITEDEIYENYYKEERMERAKAQAGLEQAIREDNKEQMAHFINELYELNAYDLVDIILEKHGMNNN